MYKISYSSKFLKDYKKVIGKNKQLSLSVKQTLKLLSKNPLYPALKSHKVNARKTGPGWSSSVNGDIRIVWEYAKYREILVLGIGGHSGKNKVYR